MMKTIGRAAAAGIAIVLSCGLGAAWAHHGWSAYDNDTLKSVTGTVEEISYGNPHGVLQIASDGPVRTLTLAPPGRMGRAGLMEGDIQVGDTVTAEGHVNQSDPLEMKVETLTVGDRVYELY